jgi:hypothetical protein
MMARHIKIKYYICGAGGMELLFWKIYVKMGKIFRRNSVSFLIFQNFNYKKMFSMTVLQLLAHWYFCLQIQEILWQDTENIGMRSLFWPCPKRLFQLWFYTNSGFILTLKVLFEILEVLTEKMRRKLPVSTF